MEEENTQLAEEIEEIIYLTQEIISKLNMDIPLGEDLSFLQESGFYLSIFQTIFNTENFLEDCDINVKEESSEKIQLLIDFLANEVLFINLEHINGAEIGSGNIAHIKNFLQLICALMNMEDNEEGESEKDEGEGIGKNEERVEINDVFADENADSDNFKPEESKESQDEWEDKKDFEDNDKIDLDIKEYESSVNEEINEEDINDKLNEEDIFSAKKKPKKSRKNKSKAFEENSDEKINKIMLESELDYKEEGKKTVFRKKNKPYKSGKRMSKTKKTGKTTEEVKLRPKYYNTLVNKKP